MRVWRRDGSPIPFVMVLAVAFGSLIEPVYDIAWHLYWLEDGGQWTLFTSFGLPQPVWVMPAYVMVFALPAVLVHDAFVRGVTMNRVWKTAGVLACTTAAFEITATHIGLYEYYGEKPAALFGYCLVIAIVEAAQVTGFAIIAAALRRRATRPAHALLLFPLFPANFVFDCLGAGFPTVIAINQPDPSDLIMWLSVPVSVAFAATALWWTSRLIITDRGSEFVSPGDKRGTTAPAVHPARFERQPAPVS